MISCCVCLTELHLGNFEVLFAVSLKGKVSLGEFCFVSNAKLSFFVLVVIHLAIIIANYSLISRSIV